MNVHLSKHLQRRKKALALLAVLAFVWVSAIAFTPSDESDAAVGEDTPPEGIVLNPVQPDGASHDKSIFTFLEGVSNYTGSIQTAGLLVYLVVMMLILVFMRQAKSRFFFIALPVTLIMAGLGILKSEVMYLVLIICIIGTVVQYRRLN